jgi:hypothetical protein
VGWIDTGEWLQFTADVLIPGTYEAVFTVASTSQAGRFRLLMDGAPMTGTLTVSNTGGWKQWKKVTQPDRAVPAGAHAFRFEAVAGGFNLLSIEFKLTSSSDVEMSEWRSVVPGVRFRRNYPNPFNGSTVVQLFLNEPQDVSVKIFDVRGACVRILQNGRLGAGTTDLSWDGKNGFSEPAPTGVYLFAVESAGVKKTLKTVLCR